VISDREGQPHRLVIGIAQADREARIAVLVIQIERAEHLHAVGRDGVFVANDMDMPESDRFDQRLDHLAIRNRLVHRGRRRRNRPQFIARNFGCAAMGNEG